MPTNISYCSMNIINQIQNDGFSSKGEIEPGRFELVMERQR